MKASTETQGDAFVEYAVEITFKSKGYEHRVKMTAYATTCSVMFQQMGEKPEAKSYLNNMCVPRFFVEAFVVPWCERSCENIFNDGISAEVIMKLKDEIQKLENLQSSDTDKKINKGGENKPPKCV